VILTTYRLAPRLGISECVPLPRVCAFVAWIGTALASVPQHYLRAGCEWKTGGGGDRVLRSLVSGFTYTLMERLDL